MPQLIDGSLTGEVEVKEPMSLVKDAIIRSFN
jgi:hypothetical protein